MENSMIIIFPYCENDTWMFDDRDVGLKREPFVLGMSKMLTEITKCIPDSFNARMGIKLIFSAMPFPGFEVKLSWKREEDGGNWYAPIIAVSQLEPYKGPAEVWLCPALFKYFKQAPPTIYIKVEPVPFFRNERRRNERWDSSKRNVRKFIELI